MRHAGGSAKGREVLLCTKDASAYMGRIVTPKTLTNWRSKGVGPKFVKLGPGRQGRVFYRVADLEEWLADPVVVIRLKRP